MDPRLDPHPGGGPPLLREPIQWWCGRCAACGLLMRAENHCHLTLPSHQRVGPLVLHDAVLGQGPPDHYFQSLVNHHGPWDVIASYPCTREEAEAEVTLHRLAELGT